MIFSALPLIVKKLLTQFVGTNCVKFVGTIRTNTLTSCMNIPVFICKILAPQISLTISMFFNNSLSEDIFLEYFKTATIIPIFKYLDSNSTANY